jgi:hypothetical protein
MGPIRELSSKCGGDISRVEEANVPAITQAHFHEAILHVRPSVSIDDLRRYVKWNKEFGSFRDAADVEMSHEREGL